MCVAGFDSDGFCSLQSGIAANHRQTQPKGCLVGEYEGTISLACRNFLTENLFQLVADNDFLLLHI